MNIILVIIITMALLTRPITGLSDFMTGITGMAMGPSTRIGAITKAMADIGAIIINS